MFPTIKLASKEDAELIADFSRKTFYDTFAPYNTPGDMDKFMNEQFTREALVKEAGNKAFTFFLAFIDDELAGYVKLNETKQRPEFENRPALEIARIYASNKMIGKGIGSALMQKSIDVAKERNKEVIWLGVWKENKTAIDFYKRWGFDIFGEQDFLLGDDLQKDWLMMKEINANDR